jgi:alcohol dehydrogenase
VNDVIPAPTIEYGTLAPLLVVFGAACIGVLIEAFAPRYLRKSFHVPLTLLSLAGAFALVLVQIAKLSGAKTIVMDLNQQRLDFCRKVMGVSSTVLSTGDGSEVEKIREQTHDGSLPTVVVDATGSNKSMSHALNYVGFAGRLVFVGITTNEISFPHPLMHRRELTLLASRNALAPDFKRIIQLIEDGRLDTGPWITHRVAFDELPDVFPKYAQPDSGVIKAMVVVNDADRFAW